MPWNTQSEWQEGITDTHMLSVTYFGQQNMYHYTIL